MDLNDEIRQLQDRAAEAQRALMRAEHERESATAVVMRAEGKLKDLGVSTVEEAKKLLQDLEDDLRAAVAEVRTALDESVSA